MAVLISGCLLPAAPPVILFDQLIKGGMPDRNRMRNADLADSLRDPAVD